MKIKQKALALVLAVGSILAFGSFAVQPVEAATCGGVETSIISCSQGGGTSAKDSGVWGVLLIAINILTAGIGILAVGGIAYAAVLYSSAADNAGQVEKAKEIIRNIVLGLIAFGAMYMLLNFLIPGGIFT